MKAWFSIILCALITISSVSLVKAMSTPTIEFIPTSISANSSFIVKADPYADPDEVVRIYWAVGGVAEAQGLFPKTDGMWFCYFSNEDVESNCGPSPFTSPTYPGYEYTLILWAMNQNGDVIKTDENVSIGGIALSTRTDVENNTVYMTVYTVGVSANWVKYAVYYKNLTLLKYYTDLEYNVNIVGYNGSVVLEPGDYYIAFKTSSATDFGGGIAKVTVPGRPAECPECPTDGDGVGESDIQADKVELDIVLEKDTFSRSGYKITNTGTKTFTNLNVSITPELKQYLNITLTDYTLRPNSTVGFIVNLRNIEKGMDMNTNAKLYSGSTFLTNIPINIMVSKFLDGAESQCAGKPEGSSCDCGVCCDEVCRECCVDSDCESNDCGLDYKCKPTVSDCPSGTCYYASSCPSGTTNTGYTCTGGVCCIESIPTNECAGETDGTSCTDGVCCDEICITGGECCSDYDCEFYYGFDYYCNTTDYTCKSIGNGGPTNGDGDLTGILILVAIIAAFAGIFWFFFKKYRKGGGGGEEEDEFEGELEEEY